VRRRSEPTNGSRAAALALPLLLLGACAPSATLVAPASAPRPVARERIRAGQADAVFSRAVRVLAAHGYELSRCDASLSLLETRRVETDATCDRMTCLARQIFTVKVGWRSVKLALRREVWDASVRGWVPPADDRSTKAIAREEADLVAELMAVDLGAAAASELRQGDDPCRVAIACADGRCVPAAGKASAAGERGLARADPSPAGGSRRADGARRADAPRVRGWP